MKKRIVGIVMVLTLALSAFMFGGCGKKAEDNTAIRLAGLKGPTSMGMAEMLDKSDKGETKNKYEFTVSGSADEVTPKLIKGDIDIAALPANLASILYNSSKGKVKVLAINTLGVIYITEKGDSVKSVADLKGKTIYSTGKGSTPEYVLKYILKQNGLDPEKDVKLEWKNEPTEVVAAISKMDSAIAMLPEPFVTIAKSKVKGLNTVIDLTKEWDKLKNGSACLTGVAAVNADFAEKHPQAVANFLKDYEKSINYANSNTKEAAALIEKYDIFDAAVAEKAMPNCNIKYMAGKEMKASMEGYLKVLFDAQPKSVGGKMPDEAFYYISK